MKAEHRKELQTNALADRMGRVIQRMKTRPNRSSVLTWALVGVLVLAVVIFFWSRSRIKEENAKAWMELDIESQVLMQRLARGDGKALIELREVRQTNPILAERFQGAWFCLWELGVKSLLSNPNEAKSFIKFAQGEYRELADEVKDDPVLAPAALYSIAVAEEALAIEAPEKQDKRLDQAAKDYRAVWDRFKNSAHGAEAKKRFEELEDRDRRSQINYFYTELARQVQFRGLQQQLQHFQDEARKKKK